MHSLPEEKSICHTLLSDDTQNGRQKSLNKGFTASLSETIDTEEKYSKITLMKCWRKTINGGNLKLK